MKPAAPDTRPFLARGQRKDPGVGNAPIMRAIMAKVRRRPGIPYHTLVPMGAMVAHAFKLST